MTEENEKSPSNSTEASTGDDGMGLGAATCSAIVNEIFEIIDTIDAKDQKLRIMVDELKEADGSSFLIKTGLTNALSGYKLSKDTLSSVITYSKKMMMDAISDQKDRGQD